MIEDSPRDNVLEDNYFTNTPVSVKPGESHSYFSLNPEAINSCEKHNTTDRICYVSSSFSSVFSIYFYDGPEVVFHFGQRI